MMDAGTDECSDDLPSASGRGNAPFSHISEGYASFSRRRFNSALAGGVSWALAASLELIVGALALIARMRGGLAGLEDLGVV